MKTKLIAPPGAEQPRRDQQCLYTVSVDPAGVRHDLVLPGYEWVRANFRSVTCLVGDGPLLERTAAVTGSSLQDAADRARRLAGNFDSLCLVSDLAATADFAAAYSDVQAARREFPALSRAVRADARAYVARIRRRGDLAIDLPDAVATSIEYIEIELATYLCLARRGLLLDIYVGDELPVLRKFIEGRLPHILPPLERRIFLGLIPRAP